jgi:hypothetical protein
MLMLISSTPTGNRFVLVWYVQMPFAYEKPSSDFETPGLFNGRVGHAASEAAGSR